MREAYQTDLQNLREDLVHMASLVETAIRDASSALLTGDLALAERVITADVHIDDRQTEMDEKIIGLLARQAPVASDLRLLVAALRMSATLERMGDLCEHIALVARRRHPDNVVPEDRVEQVTRMSQLAIDAIHAAAQVVETRDLALAAQVEKRDDELDDAMQDLYREVTTTEGYSMSQAMDLTLLGRFYERLGDHSVSLVRRIGFLVTGDSIDSRAPFPDVSEF